MRKLFWFILFIIVVLPLEAQTIRVNAPSQVKKGENFRVEYYVPTQNVSAFKLGDIPSGLELIAGPSESRQSSYQYINGKSSSSSSITYTIILNANKNGKFTVSPFRVTISGRTIASSSATINVSGVSKGGNGAPAMHNYYDNNSQGFQGNGIGKKELFIKVSANKSTVYEQEPILLTYKVYTTTNEKV